MAAVFLAHEFALNRKVALKVMSPALMMGEGMVERFRQEAVTQANLQHAHIVGVHGTGTVDDLHFFIMQFIAGRTLQQVLRSELAAGRLLAIPVVQAILFQAGSALGYAHRRGVIHRDIKPANIMLNGDGDAVVTDFGIAKVAEAPSQTMTGTVIGTPTYMSPEQCFAMELTPASVQYSLGVVAYELLTGRPPFEGTSFVLMSAHTKDPPPPITRLRPDCPPEVDAAVMRMLAKDRDQRYQDLGDALHDLGAQAPGVRSDDPLRREMQRLADVQGVESKLADVLRSPMSPVPRSKAVTRGTHGSVADATPAPTKGTQGLVAGATPVAPTRGPAPSATQVLGGSSAEPADAAHTTSAYAASGAALPTPNRASTRRGLLVGGGVAIAIAAAFGIWTMTRPTQSPPPPASADSGASVVAQLEPVSPAGRDTATGVPTADAEASTTKANLPAPPIDPALGTRVTPLPVLRLEGPATLPVNERGSFTARLEASDGSRTRPERVAWSSSNPAVAVIDSRSGELRALATGTTTITGRSDGQTATRVVAIAPATVSASPAVTATPTPASPQPPGVVSEAGPPPGTKVRAPEAVATEKSEGELVTEAEQTLAAYAQALSSRDTTRIRHAFALATPQLLAQWQSMYDATTQTRAALVGVQRLDKVSATAGTVSRFRVTQTVSFTVSGSRGAQTQKAEYIATMRRESSGWTLTAISER